MRAVLNASPRANATAHLQRALNHPHARPATLVQRRMVVGPPDDASEREAARVAARVVQRLPAPAPTVQAVAAVGGGRAAEAASPDVVDGIAAARGGGRPLDAGLQQRFGSAMGADFSGVRVHADGRSDELNHTLQSRAFTTGRDVFFRRGAYDPHSRSGQELIAHELTHVVQQGASGDRIQRDIGFEFETRSMISKKSNTGALPAAGFASTAAGAAVANATGTTRVAKGSVLLSGPGVELQADDGPVGSDVEIVTKPFKMSNTGRAALDTAMTAVGNLEAAYPPFAAAAGGYVPARALAGTAGFSSRMNDGILMGDLHTATTGPQVTFGIRAGNIGDIVADLHDAPGEAAPLKGARDPGRLHMRDAGVGTPGQPKPVAGEAATLVNALQLARNAIGAQQGADVTAPGGPELEGFLTIVFTYCEGVQHKMAFLKSHTPLMAKTNLATIFATLPPNVRTYYSTKTGGVSRLEQTVARAPGYAAKMNQPLFHNVGGLAEDDQPMGTPQWYHSLTLESWLRGLVLRDRTKGEAFAQFFNDKYHLGTQRPGTDQLTTKSFPGRPANQEVEGYGALGERTDRDETTATRLPVFELRSATKLITYAQARQWALDFFDYIRSLNQNPGGGHTRM